MFVELPQQQAEEKQDWTCVHCSYKNFADRLDCRQCGRGLEEKSQAGPVRKSNYSFRPGDWSCPVVTCLFQNYSSRQTCKRCGASRPSSYSVKPYERKGYPKPRPTDRPGDWYCANSSCRYHNYASRAECYRCKTPKAQYNVPSGQYGEWICSNPVCKYHNYGGRDNCSMCGTLKPANGQFSYQDYYQGYGWVMGQYPKY